MVGTYEIREGERTVGQVRVVKEGLYYRFSCRCSLSGEVLMSLRVCWGGGEMDLGICVPMDGRFGVEKRVPCKRFGEGTPEFSLRPRHEKLAGRFVPIYPEEPFSYLHRLEGAFLARQAGQLGIQLKE